MPSLRKRPVVLLLDNHDPRLSIAALDYRKQNGVTVLSFSQHCSHKLQLLDVSVYGPLKTYENRACDAWITNHPGSQAALKAFKAVRTKSPLVHQCQKVLNDISIRHAVGLFWVPGHAGIRGHEIADGIARGGTALRFLGPEPALGVSRRDSQMRLGRWQVNQQGTPWRDLGDTQRQAHEFISGPSLGTRAKFMTFNRTQSRAITGLLTGRNTLRRHLHLLGLLDSPLCRKCGVGEET